MNVQLEAKRFLKWRERAREDDVYARHEALALRANNRHASVDVLAVDTVFRVRAAPTLRGAIHAYDSDFADPDPD